MIRKNGGRVEGGDVIINSREIRPVRLEVNFSGLRPTEKRELAVRLQKEYALDFEGMGIVVGGEARQSSTGPTGREDERIGAEMRRRLTGFRVSVILDSGRSARAARGPIGRGGTKVAS